MKFLKKAVPVIAIVLSVVAITLSCVTIVHVDRNKILDYYGASQNAYPFFAFFTDDIEEMYVENDVDPSEKGYFFDEKLLEQIRDLLKNAVYQEAANEDLGEAASYIVFKGKQHEYSVSAGYRGVIRVRADEKVKYFYTSVGYELNSIIFEASERSDLTQK